MKLFHRRSDVDHLASRDRKIERLRHQLAERDKTIATVTEQRNKVLEHLRRVQDENAALKGAPR